MLAQSIRRSLTATALAIVLVALTSITGSSATAAQDNFRERKLGRDARMADSLNARRQKREDRLWKENLKREKQIFKRQPKEKDKLFLKSKESREFKLQERRDLMQRKRLEKESLKPSLKSRTWRIR